MKKKLKLEILDPTGEVVRTHHFHYETIEGNRLLLTVDKHEYLMTENGKMMELPEKFREKTGVDEQWATEFKGVHQPVVDNTSTPPKYFNKETGKTQKLFCEEVLIPTWTVRYEDPNTGNKGEALYMTVSAKSEDEAKTQALACSGFNQHILPQHFEKRYLTAYKARGNYVIGEVQYFEGDPRL